MQFVALNIVQRYDGVGGFEPGSNLTLFGLWGRLGQVRAGIYGYEVRSALCVTDISWRERGDDDGAGASSSRVSPVSLVGQTKKHDARSAFFASPSCPSSAGRRARPFPRASAVVQHVFCRGCPVHWLASSPLGRTRGDPNARSNKSPAGSELSSSCLLLLLVLVFVKEGQCRGVSCTPLRISAHLLFSRGSSEFLL